MEDSYKYYLSKFIEKTTFSKPFMMFLDKNGVFMDGFDDANIYIYHI